MKLPPLSADKLAQLIGVASDIALVITHQGSGQEFTLPLAWQGGQLSRVIAELAGEAR